MDHHPRRDRLLTYGRMNSTEHKFVVQSSERDLFEGSDPVHENMLSSQTEHVQVALRSCIHCGASLSWCSRVQRKAAINSLRRLLKSKAGIGKRGQQTVR